MGFGVWVLVDEEMKRGGGGGGGGEGGRVREEWLGGMCST